MSRLLAIGDIHGCYSALISLIKAVDLHCDDVIVTLGDYVDRGPNSKQVLEWLIAQHTYNKLVCLRGNHEVMMLNAREQYVVFEEWLEYGGKETLESYALPMTLSSLEKIPTMHWHCLEQTLSFFETDDHFFVHANADYDLQLNEQDDHTLFWKRFDNSPRHCSGKTMICGHTSQKTGLPLKTKHAICIDTWAYGSGWLTCLEVLTGKYWQANQNGDTRIGWLNE